jgi:CheY-like chemotaxis protein/anti-sigma regulatory factor (Ser/Thr protein kinase)
VFAPSTDALCTTPLPTTTPAPKGGVLLTVPTILLVEDSATQRRLVNHLLQECGNWNIVQAADGLAALEQMERSIPSIVLTDIFMPRMDGLGLVEEIRARFPQVPVVLMTGQGSEQIAVDALKAGAADYVPKRILNEALAGILDRVLENTQAEISKHRLLSGMTGRVTRFALDNDPTLVSTLIAGFRADLLVLGVCDQNGATRTGIALEEALLNAIYHGNLEVSSELRCDGDEPFHRLAQERREQEPYQKRRVHVSARMTRQKATFVIADQGPGFDVSQLPDPTDPANLDKPSGRGLLLMRMFMDEVRHNSTGNQITLVKHRTTPEQAV